MLSKCVVGTVLIVASLLLARTGLAEGSSPIHRGPWPIRDGFNHQPTEHELEALHLRDVTPDQAREIDRLYDQLLSGSENARNQYPTPRH
jgi:hypothetical protein